MAIIKFSLSLSVGRNERQIGHVKAMPHANGQTREPPTKPPAGRAGRFEIRYTQYLL